MPRRGHLWCACQTTYALHTLDFTQPALSQRTQRTHSLGVVVPLRDHTPPIAVPHAVAAAGQRHPSAFRQGRHLESEREGSELPPTSAAARARKSILVYPRWRAGHRHSTVRQGRLS